MIQGMLTFTRYVSQTNCVGSICTGRSSSAHLRMRTSIGKKATSSAQKCYFTLAEVADAGCVDMCAQEDQPVTDKRLGSARRCGRECGSVYLKNHRDRETTLRRDVFLQHRLCEPNVPPYTMRVLTHCARPLPFTHISEGADLFYLSQKEKLQDFVRPEH